jgi:hypothetical protein
MEIFKFYLEVRREQKIPLTKGAKILSVAEQFGEVALWAICEPNSVIEERVIYIFGTGQLMPKDIDSKTFLGTVVTDGGNYVWHVFE